MTATDQRLHDLAESARLNAIESFTAEDRGLHRDVVVMLAECLERELQS